MSLKNHDSPQHPMSPTRRQVLQVLGTGALAVAVERVASRRAFAAAPAPQPTAPATQPMAGAPMIQPFPLADVRLLDGPFLEAQKRDEAYLLKLEADRMLHNFRVNAGLQPKAEIYGGWESVRTWVDIRCHGHTLGHYLSAASFVYASTGHDEIKKRVDYILAELKECQDAVKTGLINAFPDNDTQILNMVNGRRVTGVPWYTTHKVMAGLRDAYLCTGSDLAKDILVKLTDYIADVTKDMTDDAFQRMLGTEHGGMNEVLGDVYTFTKNDRHLALAERFCHKQVLDPLSQGRDTLNGQHSNTNIPKFVGFERLFQLTGKAQYHAAAEFFWKTVTGTRSFATGGNGDGEHFFPVNQFAQKVTSAKTMETCCTHNMLKLTRLLFAHDPQAAYGDYYERALFNAILGSQDPDTGMVTYFQSTKPGYIKLFCTPFDSFWCCTGTGIENHAKYGDSIYFRANSDAGVPTGAPRSDALYVNLFIASTLNWKDKGITVKQVTNFPEAGKTRLEITAAAPTDMALHIRKPAWTADANVSLNGGKVEASAGPADYFTLQRTWKTGDVVEVELPMALHMELLPGTTDTAAVEYGPLVLVGAMGHEVKVGDDLTINERNIGTPLNVHVDVPAFTGTLPSIVTKIKPAGAPLTFKTDGIAGPTDVTLVPYYKMAHQHYNMYWKIQDA